jgi:hypothetical protein
MEEIFVFFVFSWLIFILSLYNVLPAYLPVA